MIHKVLVVAKDVDREVLEQALQEVVQAGGEVLLADKRENALQIIKKELPQLVFLDSDLAGEKTEWMHEGVHLVWLFSNKEQVREDLDCLVTPIRPDQVQQKCHAILRPAAAASVPPM